MSYNIDDVKIVKSSGFSIPVEKLEEWQHKYEGSSEIPEGNFLEYADDCFDINGEVANVTKLWWYGEGSGRTFELLVSFLSDFDGEADLVLTWEGGDSHSGLRLRNHIVTEHHVEMTLGEEANR